MEVYQRIYYTHRILRGAALKKYKVALMDCKQSAKDLLGDKVTLGYLKALSTKDFWTWGESYGIVYGGYT